MIVCMNFLNFQSTGHTICMVSYTVSGSKFSSGSISFRRRSNALKLLNSCPSNHEKPLVAKAFGPHYPRLLLTIGTKWFFWNLQQIACIYATQLPSSHLLLPLHHGSCLQHCQPTHQTTHYGTPKSTPH